MARIHLEDESHWLRKPLPPPTLHFLSEGDLILVFAPPEEALAEALLRKPVQLRSYQLDAILQHKGDFYLGPLCFPSRSMMPAQLAFMMSQHRLGDSR